MTLTEVAALCGQILAVGAAFDAAEILARPADYASSGIYSWSIVRSSHRWSAGGPIAALLDRMFSLGAFNALMGLQIALAAGLLLRAWPQGTGALISALFALRLLIHLRHEYGLDGSDQMHAVLLGALSLFYVAPAGIAQYAAILFIAFQSMLAYTSSGGAKLTSPLWRSGKALPAILNTHSYGSSYTSRALAKHLTLSRAMCWSIMGFQCSFTFLALASPKTCAIALTLGAIFHLSIAVLMGLNDFVWSFPAAYPAVWKISNDLASYYPWAG